MKYIRTKEVPKIREQEGESCFAYALAALVEYHLWQKGTNVYLDALEFYDRLQDKMGKRKGNTAIAALKLAKSEGFLTRGGIPFGIKDYKRVSTKGVWGFPEPLYVGVDIENGENLTKRLDKNCVVKKRLQGYHQMLYMETFGRFQVTISLANTWGKNWGDSGYCYAHRTLQTKNDPFIMDAYQIFV